MLRIKLNIYSNGKWREQECYARSLEECKRIYGLGVYCEYRIVSIESV